MMRSSGAFPARKPSSFSVFWISLRASARYRKSTSAGISAFTSTSHVASSRVTLTSLKPCIAGVYPMRYNTSSSSGNPMRRNRQPLMDIKPSYLPGCILLNACRRFAGRRISRYVGRGILLLIQACTPEIQSADSHEHDDDDDSDECARTGFACRREQPVFVLVRNGREGGLRRHVSILTPACAKRLRCGDSLFALGQERHKQERDDVDDFYHRVDSRTGGVLVRVADGVAGDRGFVRLGALAAVSAFLNVLLGVVPSGAAGRHRNAEEQTGNDGAHQKSAECRRSKQQTDQNRNRDGNECRHYHLTQSGFRHDVHGSGIIRLRSALHNTLDLFELTAHFFHDRFGGFADRAHRDRSEEVREESAEQ